MGDERKNVYWNPYLCGIGMGLVLLAAFVIMGRGIGASGAFTSILTSGINGIFPAYAANNDLLNEYLSTSNSDPIFDWLVFEIIGVILGGFFSGFLAKRNKFNIVKGEGISNKSRLVFAFAGGLLMGFAAKMARGCTSGLALSGGALLSLGSWVFMLSVFAGAYLLAYFVRRLWI